MCVCVCVCVCVHTRTHAHIYNSYAFNLEGQILVNLARPWSLHAVESIGLKKGFGLTPKGGR